MTLPSVVLQRRQPAAPHSVGAVRLSGPLHQPVRSVPLNSSLLSPPDDCVQQHAALMMTRKRSGVVPCCLTVLSPQTVVELFYQTAARKIIISQIYCQQQSPSLLHWSHMMSSVVHLLAQLLYP